MVDDNRAIFMYKDGAQAWEAKNYLVEQDRCLSVTVENKVYPGKANTQQVGFLLLLIFLSVENPLVKFLLYDFLSLG